MTIEIKDYDKEIIISVLTELRLHNTLIEYGEVVSDVEKRTGVKHDAHFSLNYPLGRIQDACRECGLPCLSVRVVKGGMHRTPGSGFIDYYREANPDDERSDRQIIKEEQNACRNCKDWQRLLDYCGIEWALPEKRDVLADLSNEKYVEGIRKYELKVVEEVSRDPKARSECLHRQGTKCAICGFDSEMLYGIPGIIHVHHMNPIAKGVRETDPVENLIPVCPNCHAIIHSKPGYDCYTPDEVREMLRTRRE